MKGKFRNLLLFIMIFTMKINFLPTLIHYKYRYFPSHQTLTQGQMQSFIQVQRNCTGHVADILQNYASAFGELSDMNFWFIPVKMKTQRFITLQAFSH